MSPKVCVVTLVSSRTSLIPVQDHEVDVRRCGDDHIVPGEHLDVSPGDYHLGIALVQRVRDARVLFARHPDR